MKLTTSIFVGLAGLGSILAAVSTSSPPLTAASASDNRAPAIWEPSPGHVQEAIWAGPVPDPLPNAKPESVGPPPGREWWPRANDVSKPTMTIYLPKGQNTGAAAVVLPGGGYQFLAMDLEGTEICDWLTSRGITCVLLKYRVPDSGPTLRDGKRYYPKVPTALQDAQRTVGLVRQRAKQYRIDPNKIGVIGFSAGGASGSGIEYQFRKACLCAGGWCGQAELSPGLRHHRLPRPPLGARRRR